MNKVIIFIPDLSHLTKNQRVKWLQKEFGSGVINNPCILFLTKSKS